MMGRVSAERERERELARATSVCGDSSRKLWGDGPRRRMEIHLHFGGATDTEQPHDPQNLQESKNTTTKKKGKRKGMGSKMPTDTQTTIDFLLPVSYFLYISPLLAAAAAAADPERMGTRHRITAHTGQTRFSF